MTDMTKMIPNQISRFLVQAFFWDDKGGCRTELLVPFASNVQLFFCLIVEQFNTKMLNLSSDTLLNQSRSDI